MRADLSSSLRTLISFAVVVMSWIEVEMLACGIGLNIAEIVSPDDTWKPFLINLAFFQHVIAQHETDLRH